MATGVGGLGVGLYISAQIMKAHHGTLTLDSVEGQGTTAIITLPRIKI